MRSDTVLPPGNANHVGSRAKIYSSYHPAHRNGAADSTHVPPTSPGVADRGAVHVRDTSHRAYCPEQSIYALKDIARCSASAVNQALRFASYEPLKGAAELGILRGSSMREMKGTQRLGEEEELEVSFRGPEQTKADP